MRRNAMQRGEEIGRNPAAHIRGPGTSVPIHTAVMILLVICYSLVSRILGGGGGAVIGAPIPLSRDGQSTPLQLIISMRDNFNISNEVTEK